MGFGVIPYETIIRNPQNPILLIETPALALGFRVDELSSRLANPIANPAPPNPTGHGSYFTLTPGNMCVCVCVCLCVCVRVHVHVRVRVRV